MVFKSRRLFFLALIFYGISSTVLAEPIDDPCGGASALLNIIDRPTVGDSACVVPFKKIVLESGFQYQKLNPSNVSSENLPEAEVRIGLPANNEFVLILPNYQHQSISPHSGANASTVGIKHEIGYTKKWLGAIEGLITIPNGTPAFSDSSVVGVFNGILNYTFNPKFSLTLMLGASIQKQFTSINPDAVLTYVMNEKINFYAEVYGQSKTAVNEKSGFNADGGVIFLAMKNIAVDLEIGQRLSGNLGGFKHYIGTGVSILF